MSYFAADPDWWPAIRAALPRPFPREAALTDLAWTQDQCLRGRRRRFPSRAELSDLWGWTDKRVRLLVASAEEWADPLKAEAWEAWRAERRPVKVPGGSDEGPGGGQDDGPPNDEGGAGRAGPGPDGGQSGASPGPDDVHTRGDPPHRTDTDTAREPPPSPPAGGVQPTFAFEAEPTEPDPEPIAWARARKGKPRVDAKAVVDAIEAIRCGPVNPQRCATDAKHVIGLQAATGTPWRELAEDIALVARWARESRDGLAENDIRGHDRRRGQWGTDRSRVVATITVHERWSDRLAAAKRWRDGGSRDPPSGRGNHPGRPELTPEDRDRIARHLDEHGFDGPPIDLGDYGP